MKHPRAEIHEAFHSQLPSAVYKYPSIVARPRNEEETGQNFVTSSDDEDGCMYGVVTVIRHL
jgi:hypothetical protein